jgi:molecular chaperone Hsp33
MSPDRVLRAMTDDGAFRVIAAETTATSEGVVRAQGAEGHLAQILAELVTGSILTRETMAPDHRVQAILQWTNPPSQIVADSHPDGTARGLLKFAARQTGGAGLRGAQLGVLRTLRDGQVQQGVVAVPDEATVSSAFAQYMQSSEQIVTIVSVGAVLHGARVAAAGGYLVQLLPEVGEGPLMVMTERMGDFPTMATLLERGESEPGRVIDEILYGMPFTRLGESALSFGCHCDQARLAASLATLPRRDIEEIIVDGRMLEIECEYCKKQYQFAPQQLRGLVAQH